MKLPRTLLKLKLKAGNLSKSDKVAFLAKEAAKAKPVASHITKALPDVITSKPIVGRQVHATNRERRALRRLKNASPFFEAPLASSSPIPSSSASNDETGSHVGGKMSIFEPTNTLSQENGLSEKGNCGRSQAIILSLSPRLSSLWNLEESPGRLSRAAEQERP